MGSSDHLHSESLDTASQLNFRIYIHKLMFGYQIMERVSLYNCTLFKLGNTTTFKVDILYEKMGLVVKI